ncbi:CDP-glucose 4,6-dehydratase [Butyricicoccus faecihominis]|uniref:CDP-glucose 4,6-dehydratase n=1 Tax=Butyricicoccus faecihominis TaxID=1712515 RepID=UPI003843821D|nr:CDP-glucose 4,6-dehydratase [Butyricicoccus faecihominis]
MLNLDFYNKKRVFLTGHTGFKGAWMCQILANAGAIVTGYSLAPPTTHNLFQIAGLQNKITSVIGDVRDFDKLQCTFNMASPEIVIHMAAQPLVREGYKNPRNTYDVNVMGTVNLLECVRQCHTVKSVLNVTTDKVYLNHEWCWGYRESDKLDGFDPYSNSKSCSELVTHSYINSFFCDNSVAISTARAGNVIGGGDFAENRIIPDCVRAMRDNRVIVVRNPDSTRPYQHVLDPLAAYLMIVQKQYEDPQFAGFYNIGPDDCDCVTTGELVNLFCRYWGENARWENQAERNAPHEANYLKLDSTKIKTTIGWKPLWHIEDAIQKICEWTKVYFNGLNVSSEMNRQIELYMGA